MPAAHTPVTLDSPVVAQYDPAGHGVHALAPALATKEPTPQLVHDEADMAEYVPTRQDEQVVADSAE